MLVCLVYNSEQSVGTPAAGTPASGTPAVGTPAAGTPAAGTPAAGTPAAGTSAAGTPAAGTWCTTSHLNYNTQGKKISDKQKKKLTSNIGLTYKKKRK